MLPSTTHMPPGQNSEGLSTAPPCHFSFIKLVLSIAYRKISNQVANETSIAPYAESFNVLYIGVIHIIINRRFILLHCASYSMYYSVVAIKVLTHIKVTHASVCTFIDVVAHAGLQQYFFSGLVFRGGILWG